MQPADRYELIRRKHDLAQQMIAVGGRTATVMQWTGFTDYRVQQIARRFAPNSGTARWGRGYFPPRYYRRSPEIEAQSLAFICVAIEASVIPEDEVPAPRETLPELRRGEQLIEAYRFYRALVGSQHLPFERTLALMYAFASRAQFYLRHCRDCGDVMMTIRIARKIRCPYCRAPPGSPSEPVFEAGESPVDAR